jgi:hypothetical protein
MSNQTEDDEICGWTEIEPEFDHQRQAFQRGRDGLVVAIERDGRRSQNVVTLPENYHQDNKIIDCIRAGVEPEDAAETARAFMEQNNATMDVTLTEYLSAARNTDDSIEGAAKITHIQNGTGVWQTDDGERLEDDPDEYCVVCSCG